jgi:CBS domain-containing protein
VVEERMAEKRPSLRGLRVEDVMTKEVKTIDGGKPLQDCIKMMRDSEIGCVIVTEKGTPVGIFTERDLLRKVAEDPGNLRLAMSDVMSGPLSTILPAATIWDAIRAMNNSKIRHLPVVNNGRLVGILTERDVFRLFFSYNDLMLAALKLEETRRFLSG